MKDEKNKIHSKTAKKEKKFWIFFFRQTISSEEKVNGGNRKSFKILFLFLVLLCI